MINGVATAAELAKLRTDNQQSALRLAFHLPTIVARARVNQSFSTFDQVTEITFDNLGFGDDLNDVLPGMIAWIGSNTDTDDKGRVRIRKAPTATVFYIGETSEIAWADNDYITITDDFEIFPRLPRAFAGEELMDWDVEYSDQHASPDPVCNMGPDQVLTLTGATVSFQPTAAASWVLGGTITAYSWAAPGASATANLTTAAPTITYNAAGTYRIDCTVTASNGKTHTGHRYVFVFSAAAPPITQFELNEFAGDFESGYWSFGVTMHAEASEVYIRGQARVILFAAESYGGVAGSIGPITGYEHIKCIGRIAGESIEWSPEEGTVSFVVQGPGYWMDHVPDYPVGLKDSAGAASTRWIFMQDLTVDKALWHLLHWRSTASLSMDIFLTGDTRLASAIEGVGTLWQQIDAAANKTILARAACNRYGQLYVEIDPQFLNATDRAAIPTVMTLLETDWMPPATIERREVAQAAMLNLSGATYDGLGGDYVWYLSRAPGSSFKHHGKRESIENLLLTDQAQANELAGLYLGYLNNKYPVLGFDLAANNPLIDIAPRQYCEVDIASEDTLRGFVCTNKKLIPRRVEYTHDPESGQMLTRVEFEGEASAENSITITREVPPTDNRPPQPPDIVDPELPPIIIPPPPYFPPPPILPPPTGDIDPLCRTTLTFAQNGPWNLFVGGTLESSDSYETFQANFPCFIRAAAATYKSTILVNGCFYKDVGAGWVADTAGDAVIVAAAAGGAWVTTAAPGTATAGACGSHEYIFSPAAGIDVMSFKVQLPPQTLTVGGSLDSGTCAYNDTDGDEVGPLTVGQWYAIESAGGPWHTRDNILSIDTDVYDAGLSIDGGASFHNIGGLTYGSEGSGTYSFIMSKPAWAESIEAVGDGQHVRVFFQALSTSLRFRTAATTPTAISGSLGWVLSDVTVERHKLQINRVDIYNVCKHATQ